ncbi:hypothetical protein [Maricaulis sp. CAU 1757]
MTHPAITALAVASTCVAAPAPGALSMPQEAAEQAPVTSLDGLVVPGRIRAQGVAGLLSVAGTLSFREGHLVWTARGETESGPYLLSESGGTVAFASDYRIANNERVQWAGTSDGRSVADVRVVWTRTPGDWVHDLLLPEQVTLTFTPDG